MKLSSKITDKGVYLITEEGCLNSTTGAFRHIMVGFENLSRSFDLVFFFKTSSIDFGDISKQIVNQKASETKKNIKARNRSSKFKGSLKDFKLFLVNFIYLIPLLIKLKQEKPAFIYERAAYLTFYGLIVAKILKIPHFYEANGLQFQRMEKYYSSFFSPIIRWIEKKTYQNSTHVFFVGTYGKYWSLPKNNWSNIENGVEQEYVDYFQNHLKELEVELNFCFVAKLMPHQQPDLLIKAFREIKLNRPVNLYLIGEGLESIEKQLSTYINVVNLGFLNREVLKKELKRMHVGIIAGSPIFQSTMKIYDYAVSKCSVIAPNTYNLKYWYDDYFISFEDGNADDLSFRIQEVIDNKFDIVKKGENFYKLVKHKFTWESTYKNVLDQIIKNTYKIESITSK